MLIINNGIDLGKSFDKLKTAYFETEPKVTDSNVTTANKLSKLRIIVATHLLKCTDIPEEEMFPRANP